MAKEVKVQPKTEKVRTAEQVFEEQIVLPTGETVTIKELVEREVQRKLEERLKRAIRPPGARMRAIRKLCELLYEKGSLVKTQKELREFAKIASEEAGIKFTWFPALRRGYIHKVVYKDPEAGTIRMYVLSQKAVEEFNLGKPKEEIEKAEVEVVKEKAEAVEEVKEAEAPEVSETEEVEEEIEKALES
jgi:hypothetical protein